jgi:hypothetical protein
MDESSFPAARVALRRGAARHERRQRMSGRTQLWLGSILLAAAVGFLAGGLFVLPAAQAQGPEAGPTSFGIATGIPGTERRTQTLYVVDDASDIFYCFEYSARAGKFKNTAAADIRRASSELIRRRAARRKAGRP